MTHSVGFHPLARRDLLRLYEYIEAEAGPERAAGYVERIEHLCASLAEFPERTVSRSDLVPGLRTLAMGRRLLVALTVGETTVTILRVLYAGSDLRAEDIPR